MVLHFHTFGVSLWLLWFLFLKSKNYFFFRHTVERTRHFAWVKCWSLNQYPHVRSSSSVIAKGVFSEIVWQFYVFMGGFVCAVGVG